MKTLLTIGAITAASALALGLVSARATEPAQLVPAPLADEPAPASGTTETAVLSGGCFWGVQGVFEHVKGVEQVLAGYSGGNAGTANYETVSTGTTGHAESVQIKFDPGQISYGQILQIFFSVALDPTEINRQGPDAGTQYRSEIFYGDAAQEHVAKAYVAQLDQAHVFTKPIATRVDALTRFYPAEGYHQDFLVHNPDYPYIAVNDLPKVANLERLFPSLYQPAAILSTGERSSS